MPPARPRALPRGALTLLLPRVTSVTLPSLDLIPSAADVPAADVPAAAASAAPVHPTGATVAPGATGARPAALPPFGAALPGGARAGALELAALLAGEPVSDAPAAVAPTVAVFVALWQGAIDTDAERERYLRPLLPLLVGTGDASGNASGNATGGTDAAPDPDRTVRAEGARAGRAASGVAALAYAVRNTSDGLLGGVDAFTAALRDGAARPSRGPLGRVDALLGALGDQQARIAAVRALLADARAQAAIAAAPSPDEARAMRRVHEAAMSRTLPLATSALVVGRSAAWRAVAGPDPRAGAAVLAAAAAGRLVAAALAAGLDAEAVHATAARTVARMAEVGHPAPVAAAPTDAPTTPQPSTAPAAG